MLSQTSSLGMDLRTLSIDTIEEESGGHKVDLDKHREQALFRKQTRCGRQSRMSMDKLPFL